jgi:hypothetical protein
MTAKTSTEVAGSDAALISNRFLIRLTIFIAILAAVTIAISATGRMLGERIALAGHTESVEPVDLIVGQDQIRLEANPIRFEEQRQSGRVDRVDLYLTWPELEGYADSRRKRFNDVAHPESLVFLQLSQSTMSRDMSGRLAPIYRHLFEGAAQSWSHGLTLHRLKENSGYGDEVFLTGTMPDGSAYAVRCLLPATGSQSTGADCQRDIHVGTDLSLLYRFSSRLLPQWQAMEGAVRAHVEHRLVDGAGQMTGNGAR